MSEKRTSVFCDWVSVSQIHTKRVPQMAKTVALIFDTESGEVIGEAPRGFQHEGSYDSRLLITSFGNRVSLSGNLSRLNKQDNVFGHTIDQTKHLCNEVLTSLNLPAFSSGTSCILPTKKHRPHRLTWTGAKFSRIDLTQNMLTGSQLNASDFVYWLSVQKLNRGDVTKVKNTVYFGASSGYSTIKVYNKAIEFNSNKKFTQNLSEDDKLYRKKLEQFLISSGAVRLEFVAKRKYLSETGLNHWANVTNDSATQAYLKGLNNMQNLVAVYDDVDSLSPRVRAFYHAYMRGENVREYYSDATFYRYRKQIKNIGVDIAQPLNVQALKTKVKTIDLTVLEQPVWYRAS